MEGITGHPARKDFKQAWPEKRLLVKTDRSEVYLRKIKIRVTYVRRRGGSGYLN